MKKDRFKPGHDFFENMEKHKGEEFPSHKDFITALNNAGLPALLDILGETANEVGIDLDKETKQLENQIRDELNKYK